MDSLLSVITGLDSLFAALLGVLLIAALSPYRGRIPSSVFRWGTGLGLALCLAWWVAYLITVRAHLAAQRLGEGGFFVVSGLMFLPASVLGMEAGLVGLIGLTSPLRLVSFAVGSLSALPGFTLLALMIRTRLR